VASFLDELKRRNVFRVGVAYLVVAWVLLQLTDLVFENLNAPDWVMQVIMLMVAIGFPIALILAWAFEVTPEGVRPEHIDPAQAVQASRNTRLFYVAVALIAIGGGGLLLMQGDRSGNLATDSAAAPQAGNTTGTQAGDTGDSSLLAIAVLPFESFTEDREDQFFADGLADTLLHKLAQLQTLTVIARNSSFQFKGQNVDVREIGEKLGVPTVVEGSVQRQGEQVRIIAQLVSTSDGAHLWSGTFDGTFENIFALQDNVATAIAEQLQITLSDQDRERLNRRGTNIPEAYETLVRAYALDSDFDGAGFDPDDNPRLALLRKVVELDPEYALGWTSLSSYFNALAFFDTDSARFDEFVADSKAAAQKAIEADPDESAAYGALGYAHWRLQEIPEAEAAYRTALAINPNNHSALSGLGLIVVSRDPEEAYRLFSRSQVIDPTSVIVYRQLFFTLVALGRPADGIVQLEKGLALDPDFFLLYVDLADLHANNFGRYDLAAKALSGLLRRDSNSRAGMSRMAENWFAVNDLQRARAWNEKLLQLQPGDSDGKDLQIRLLRVQGDLDAALAVAESLPAQGFAAVRRNMNILPICMALGDNDCAVKRLEEMLRFLAGLEARSERTMPGIRALLDLHSGMLRYPDEAAAQGSLQKAAATFAGFSLFAAGGTDIDSRRYYLAEVRALQGLADEAVAELLSTLDTADGGFVSLASVRLRPGLSPILSGLSDQPGYEEWLAEFTARRTAMRERMIEMEAAGEIARTP
jgi:TolB-like protein/Tfp pilus assembly protein PilF